MSIVFEQNMVLGASQMGYAREFKARVVQRHFNNGLQGKAKSTFDIRVSKSALRAWLEVYKNPVMMAGSLSLNEATRKIKELERDLIAKTWR